MENLKGFVVFYINYTPNSEGLTLRDQIDLFKEINKDFIQVLEDECRYKVTIIPTTKESCRVEKVEFDQPFPRFIPNSIDVQENHNNKMFIRGLMEKKFGTDKED